MLKRQQKYTHLFSQLIGKDAAFTGCNGYCGHSDTYMLMQNLRPALFLLMLPGTGTLQAGPPLAIDDPGTLEPGNWELIAAT